MAQNNKRADELVSSIDHSLEQLDELERSYLEQKSQITNAVALAANQLGQLADSQALRAQLIHKLYWNKKIPADIIGAAFGLKIQRMIKIAGSFAMNFPCANSCGGELTKTFTSRSDRDKYISDRVGKRWRYLRSNYLCADCSELEQLERETKEVQRRERHRRRDEELRNMPWDEFIESKEWIRHRNIHIHSISFQCEVCHESNRTLHIHLGGDSVQGHPSVHGYAFYSTVLCRDCKARCCDLINLEKGEVIRPESLEYIRDWYQEYRYSDDD
jgi:hypothetical protein